jgi:predicted Fe-Mo cluster-binding NifX family protein
MKITKFAVTAQGTDAKDAVDTRFGRARYFRVVDTATGEQIVVDNAAGMNAAQGAGIQAAQSLVNQGVQAVVTGHVGPKAWTALAAAKIQVFGIKDGTVEQAMNAFMAGQLQPMTGADVAGHW